MNTSLLIFSIIALIFSVIAHEIAHGYVAELLGDPTPRAQNRLTLNPVPHLDLMGSVVLPLLLVVSGAGFIMGWAKPVQFDPRYFKNKQWGPVLVALAGPLTNSIIAVGISLVVGLLPVASPASVLLSTVVYINILLAVFNMIPIPPLDGHYLLFAVLPASFEQIKLFLMRYSLIIFFVIVVFLWKYIQPIVQFLYTILI